MATGKGYTKKEWMKGVDRFFCNDCPFDAGNEEAIKEHRALAHPETNPVREAAADPSNSSTAPQIEKTTDETPKGGSTS